MGRGWMGRRSSPVLGVGVCLEVGEQEGRARPSVLQVGMFGDVQLSRPSPAKNLNSLPQEQRQTKVGLEDIKVFSNLVHSLILWEGNLNFFPGHCSSR